MLKLTLAQIRTALGELNQYYTEKALGRDPTAMECIEHYAAHHADKLKTDPLVKWFTKEERK